MRLPHRPCYETEHIHTRDRTRCSSLLWQLPMRDLLGLLRKHPDLYQRACRQAVPSAHFDYLAIINKARLDLIRLPQSWGRPWLSFSCIEVSHPINLNYCITVA